MKGGPMVLQRHPPVYSRAEYFSDAAIHVSGIAIAVVAVPVLIVLAAIWAGDAGTLTAIAIYGACLLAMLTCSALYNMIPKPAWKDRLRRLDQSAIYLKIAGTYTPLVALTGSQAWLLLAGIWGVALAGASLILFGPLWLKPLSTGLYLALGWAGAIWGGPLVSLVSGASFLLLLIGGLLYTIGVPFLLWQRLPHHNTIWHVFVLAATGLCYGAVFVELISRAA